ncbi:poly [ADP-ribose] polymerase 14-like isoform X4 [Pomacea canaliculata]|uniref:poly [ADP-ribose] polymerase 14-like isoform X4 n=1 Tax=Pomacea canaliculata TaxID=400727 RepID=UPI000D72CB56|nr:poly [ADP-ribose] polymerase 14-like isoform X4 [Pomacea canaliculata]
MRPFRRIFRYFHGYWSQGTPQDEEEPQEDEIFYDVPENALENQSDGETQQLREWEQELQSQEWLSCLDTGPFYSDKLFLKNVAPVVTKELLVNYMETVTGQNDIEPRYCDEPGDVLLTFKAEIDFEKVKNKCQTKLLKERQLEVWRVPVSNSILVENLSPDTDPDHVSCYFETPRANGGTVLKVQPVQDKQKCVVCFKDAKVVDDVLKVTHILGGRELRVSLYLKCLGPSGGKAEPNVFKPPATVTLTDKDNVKVRFLSHSAETLEFFNFILEDVHAQASVVGNVLMVSYKIKESTDRLDILMENWREKVNKQLEICFDYIGLESITVPQEIWYETWKAIKKSIFDHDDLVLPDEDEFTFVVLSKPAAGGNTGGNTFQQVQRIAKVKERKFKLQSREKTDTKKLKKFQLELLMLSTFLSDTQSQGMKIKVDIRLQEGEVNFRGSQMAIREAEVKMYDILQSASSRVVTDVPHVHVALLATDEARDAVNNRLRQAGLAATWECCGNGIIFYCLHQTALLQAVNLIKTSFKTECISLDEVSSSLQTTAEWKDTVQKLVRKHCGLVSINTHHRTISLTAFCDLMPTVKENIGKFVSESSIYSTAFQLSPSRLKFVTLFWEEKLSSIAEKLKQYKIKITLQSDSVLARGTKQGIELVRKELTFLSEQIVSTKELITRKETIRCLSTPRTKNELEAIACTCKCVLSLHPENVSVEMISTNLSAEGPRVHAVQGDITHLNVDVIVNAANELMDHAGGLAGHIVLKAPFVLQGLSGQENSATTATVLAMEEDITQLAVDVIVNAANERMSHDGGLAGYIVKKGGDKIQEECFRILKTRGKLSEGDVLVSGPGKLPCKRIIHAVGPVYRGGNKGEEECLRDTVMECLKTASDKGYFSIAIPAISSGIFGYPVEEATRVIVQAVRIFLDANHDSSIQVVLLCDILPKTVADFEKALKATARKGERSAGSLPGSSQTTEFLFSGKELAFSQAAGLNKPRGHQHITTSVNIVDDTMNRSTPGAVQNVNKGMVATTAPISNPRVPGFDFGGIHVTIKQGDITTEEVDAIVNSSNSQLDLSRGAVSCQLRTKCGPALESACKAKLSEIAQRKVVTTAAFNLRCKHIVHIDTYHYVNNDRLTTAYLDILTEADNLGLNSIALPAIGTGNLNISPSKSARAMGKALVAHARIRKTVRTVTVVLFEANMTRDFTVNLTARAAEQGFAPSTTSGKSDGFKRLYLPENGEDGEWTTRPQNSPLPKVLKLYIFAASQDKRADFLKALDSLVNSKFVEQEIKDFDKLSRDKLEELCGKYNLELLQRDGGASVKGMADDIQMMKEEISSMAKKAERQQQENLIANLVQWYFFEVTTTGIKRIPYQKGPNLLIENAFQNSQDTVELTDSEGTVYVVSFKDMTDSVKMCPTDSVQIMRKEIITDTANSASLLPETWEPLSSDESVKRVPLVKGCPEYQSVKASISQTAKGGFKIELIERIQNPELYKQYVAKKTQMNKQNNGIQSEKTLWHGTSSDAIDNINLYGFNRSFCGKNATVYGQGVYFAVNSSYSMSDTYSVRDQSGRKHLYQCRVLVGYPTVGNSDMKFLPTRQGKIRYDSATDRNSSPKMYIIFNDTQAYPEYLITFK